MKKIQLLVGNVDAAPRQAHMHRVGLLLLSVLISVAVVSCGGTAPSATAPLTAGQNSAVPQNTPVTQSAPTKQGNTTNQGNGMNQGQGNNGQNGQQGDSEFGLPEAEVVRRVDAVEALIASCMRDAGFEYVPVDYKTARKAMDSNSKPSGLSSKDFRTQYGYGITTQFAGADNQALMGAGAQNIRIRNGLSTADHTAYMHALYGDNPSATFVVGLDSENFSQTGGCTRKAVEQVFSKDELGANFVNYQNAQDARVDQDPRVIAAQKDWGTCMRQAGYSYNTSDEIKADLASRLDAITGGAAPDTLSADAQAALKQLQGEELAIAAADHDCSVKFVDPIKNKVATELLGPAANQ